MQEELIQLIAMIARLEEMQSIIIKTFNDNTGLYDGDPLFQPKDSPICKYWITRGKAEEVLFMNYNCGHPTAECDWGDGDHCCIMSCPDEDKGTQIAGRLVNLHSKIHPVVMKALDLFNNNKNKCDRNTGEVNRDCNHPAAKEAWCCASNCPL